MSAVAKIKAKIILGCIKKHREGLIDREQEVSSSGFSWHQHLADHFVIVCGVRISASTALYYLRKGFRKRQQEIYLSFSTHKVLHRNKISEKLEVRRGVRRYYSFLLSVTFSILHCPEDAKSFSGPCHLSANATITLMTSIFFPTEP